MEKDQEQIKSLEGFGTLYTLCFALGKKGRPWDLRNELI